MNRATGTAAARAAERLITEPHACSCDESKRLTARLAKLHELADRLEAENTELRGRLTALGEA